MVANRDVSVSVPNIPLKCVIGIFSTVVPCFAEMVATVEEMDAAKIPPKKRDYCAHYYMRFVACKKRNFGFQYRCGHEKHDWDHCQFDE
jgi:hypothetical protein